MCFLPTYLTNLLFSPVLRILLCYLESLPFLQSHHLFALDSTAVCRSWPNKNISFIIPGGQLNGQVIGVDTNIPPQKPNSPTAFSSMQIPHPATSHSPKMRAAGAQKRNKSCLTSGALSFVKSRLAFFLRAWACSVLQGCSSSGLGHWWHLSPLQRQAGETALP